jgi:formyltetrahydrofolate deformylase
LVERFGLPFHHLPHHDAAGHDLPRATHEAALAGVIDGYAAEYVVLARYMRVLSADFVGRYPDRIVNIHHSFLPAFAGASPYRQAFARGVKLIHVGFAIGVNARQQGHHIRQLAEIIPVDPDARGMGHGHQMQCVIGRAAGGQQADDAVDDGALVYQL